MKFVLVEAEIKQAIQEYAAKLISVAPGATVEVEVKATRGADGVTAEIDVALAPSVSAGLVSTAPVKPEVIPVPEEVPPTVVATSQTTVDIPTVSTTVAAEPVPEQLATATAPVAEPVLPDNEAAPLETEVAATTGKSIFG